jgi:Flp pilus assembly protein TadG
VVIIRFLQNRDAGVAPMLALAALPLFASVGASIDFGRAASARAAMQAAVDAAALLIAKDAKVVAATQMATNAADYFNANFHNSEVRNLATTVSTASLSSGYSVNMTASGAVSTRFMGLMGFSTLRISVQSNTLSNKDGLGCVLSLDPRCRQCSRRAGQYDRGPQWMQSL